jgi:hypothetical protein
VDEEFNKISFLLVNSNKDHNAVLTRNLQNGRYTLSYGGAYTNNETRTITANSLQALLQEMRNGKYKSDFDATGIRAVEAQAALIPAVVLEKAKTISLLTSTKGILSDFYISTTRFNYEKLMETYIIYLGMAWEGIEFKYIYESMSNTLVSLNDDLALKLRLDIMKSIM